MAAAATPRSRRFDPASAANAARALAAATKGSTSSSPAARPSSGGSRNRPNREKSGSRPAVSNRPSLQRRIVKSSTDKAMNPIGHEATTLETIGTTKSAQATAYTSISAGNVPGEQSRGVRNAERAGSERTQS